MGTNRTQKERNKVDSVVNFGGVELDTTRKRVVLNGKKVDLTKKEYDLLQYLVFNHDRVLTRQQLYEHIWGNILDDQYDSNFIDVHIKNLRKKLNNNALTPWLETVRGVGYRVTLNSQKNNNPE